MKEGSFINEIKDLDFADDWTAKNTPLPTELPHSFQTLKKNISENISKSSVIDSLMSQNDDLMSRLSVALRRTALLEENLNDSKNEIQQLKIQRENLNDQLLILKEKAKSIIQKNNHEKASYEDLQSQIHLLEVRYSELFTQTQKKEAHFLKKISRLEKYKQRLLKAAQSLRSKARESKNFEKDYLHSQNEQERLRTALQESASYIQGLKAEHTHALQAKESEYNHALSALEEKLRHYEIENANLREKAVEAEKLFQTQLHLQNQVLTYERRLEEEKIRTSAEISDLQKALARFRAESKQLALELDEKTKCLSATESELKASQKENQALTEQVENLQLLWRKQEQKIEKYEEKIKSLQKLNQELSITINQYRKEIRDLKQVAQLDI